MPEGRRSSFARWNDRCSQVANALIRDGAGPGARVVFFAKNSDWYYEAYVGATKANAVLVAVNWRLAPEVAYIVKDSGAEVLMVGPEFLPLIRQILPELPQVRRIIVMGEGSADGIGWEDWLADAPHRSPAADHGRGCRDPALYLGHHRPPKGVMLTNGNVLEAMKAAEIGTYGHWLPGVDRLIMCMPNFHVAGSNWGMFGLSVGAAIHILPEVDPGEDPGDDRAGAHHPRPLRAGGRAAPRPASGGEDDRCLEPEDHSLRRRAHSARPAACSAMAMFDCDFVQGYGLTEDLRRRDLPAARRSRSRRQPAHAQLRQALPGVEVDRRCPGPGIAPGRGRRNQTRSGLNMIGYWGRPDETAKTLRDGWLHTGDAGYTDADGYVYIHDRVKDMIVSGVPRTSIRPRSKARSMAIPPSPMSR